MSSPPTVTATLRTGSQISLDLDANTTVILGTNGSGKSSLLLNIVNLARQRGMQAVYVEGGRAVRLNHDLSLNSNTIGKFSDFDKSLSQYTSKATIGISRTNRPGETTRLEAALHLIKHEHEHERSRQHSLLIQERQQIKNGQIPANQIQEMPELPFESYCRLFNEIFPWLELNIEGLTKIMCKRHGSTTPPYHASNLSDGER